MHSSGSLVLLPFCAALLAAGPVNYSVVGDDPGAWPKILGSMGLQSGTPAHVVVLRDAPPAPVEEWRRRMEEGETLILEGPSALADSLGFRATERKVVLRRVVDEHAPGVRIVWEKPLAQRAVEVAEGIRVFARERWEGVPLVAGMRVGRGAVLWIAVSPGERGYERFPYLPHALLDLGVEPGVTSRGLWAFFDSSYRLRVDADYFAERWRKSGIRGLYVAAWHYNEPDAERDAWLRRLIEACHRRAILVYAWIELPHVSERFWQVHPEWREKTATLQDAHLDWRKLMNLQNAECRRAILAGLRGMVDRFDWDGINLGELYFESLEGAANPARFTPFNDDVRSRYRADTGRDPVDVVRGGDGGQTRHFLDFRADLAREMQQFWVEALEGLRREGRSHLDLVLTHVDDRFDSGMRDAIGADAARVLPLLERHDMTFLIEDPATVWHLGPERYPEIARRYRPLTAAPDKLGIDLNIVERYQNVYPTKQQTGVELLQLIHTAARAFPHVAVYFEKSIERVDAPLLGAAAAVLERYEQAGSKQVVEARSALGIRWAGAARVNGLAWPFSDGEHLWLPPGAHLIEAGEWEPALRVTDFNGELRSAHATPAATEFSYESASRSMAVLSCAPSAVEIDGERVEAVLRPGNVLVLPRGQHVVRLIPPLS
jgi:hypothetical protein